MTTIYFIRHSEKLKKGIFQNNPFEMDTKAMTLTVKGERLAKELSEIPDLEKVEKIYSSPYARCIATAKYLAEKLHLDIYLDSRLEEIKTGKKTIDNKTFNYLREHNFDYKLEQGESFHDVERRMTEVFREICQSNQNKTIAIFSHHFALFILFMNFCEIRYINDQLTLCYHDFIITLKWASPDIYKIEMNKIISFVSNIWKVNFEYYKKMVKI